MTAPVRPEPSAGDRIQRNILALRAQGASDADIAQYLTEQEHLTPEPTKPGVLSRAADQIGGFMQSVVQHPINTAASLVAAPFKSFADAVLAPGVGEARHDPRLSKGGNSSGAPIGGTYDAQHGAVTEKERAGAAAQTLANIAFPTLAGKVAGGAAKLGAGKMFANALGLSAAGGVSGATYSPNDPLAGAIAGAVMTPATVGAGRVGGRAVGAVASKAADLIGRPMETGPLFTAAGHGVGQVEGIADRAARANAEGLDRAKLSALDLLKQAQASDKPLSAIDLSGTEGVRMARGLKTSSPVAEGALRDMLEPRAASAVDRVIEHGLETTKLVNRANGLQTVDDLVAQRAQHANESYPPIFEKHPAPLDNPAFDAIAKTPAGALALKRAEIIAANRGERIGSITETSTPPEGVTAEAWAHAQALAKQRGLPVPENPGAPKRIAPTLQQAHFVKLAFDDMLASPPERGSGGSGPVNLAAIRDLKARWLKAMDAEASDYGEARKTFADESDLIRAAETGRKLWSMHPDEAAKAFREMSEGERDVARRTGFDALADRIENGPADVSKGASKPRDLKRMRLLFPDDASFQAFQEGIKKEADMLASKRAVLEGSNTADKIVDMADMAGVAIPAVVRAMRGNPAQLVGQVAHAMLKGSSRANADALAVERVRQLTAGANGDVAARQAALERIARQQSRSSPTPRRPTFAALLPSGTQGPAPERSKRPTAP